MDAFIDFFLDPFRFAYMQKAFLITFLIAMPMAAMSSLMVLKGWSLLGDAMSHAVLPGIVLAYIAGLPLVIGAFIAGLFCAVATGWLNANSRVKEDTVDGHRVLRHVRLRHRAACQRPLQPASRPHPVRATCWA